MFTQITKIAVFAMLSVVFSPFAYSGDTPLELAGTTVIDASKAQALSKDGKTKIYDVRVKLEYAEEHIPGAISMPYGEKSKKEVGFDASLDKFDVSRLPSTKSASIIFYCNGPECWKSFKASTSAAKAGYTAIYWFRGGLPEWKKAGMATAK